ncbi:hypothetical protein CL633_02900 [bacterium]|nr:hypothetical protein [bacterium]|tara:strand:- start:55 stop:249 length:195 start_codon:yes stop_codon:yes gene_type:complete
MNCPGRVIGRTESAEGEKKSETAKDPAEESPETKLFFLFYRKQDYLEDLRTANLLSPECLKPAR